MTATFVGPFPLLSTRTRPEDVESDLAGSLPGLHEGSDTQGNMFRW